MSAPTIERPAARVDGWIRAAHRQRRWLWLAAAVPTVVLTLLIMVVLPPRQTLTNLGDWAFRLSPLVLGVLTVALLPRWRFGGALLLLAPVAYMGFVDTGLVLRILEFGETTADEQVRAFQSIYQWELLTATFVVLFGLTAYRMGGARTTSVLKIGIASVLVVVSGLNDVTFWLTYDWPDGRPSHLRWASHIAVFVGGPPSAATAIAFLLVHLALAAVVVLLPLERYVDRAIGDREGAA